MELLKDLSDWICEVTWWVDDNRDECHNNVTNIFLVLHDTVLDIDGVQDFHNNRNLDHVDSRLIVPRQGCQCIPRGK